MTPRPSVRDAKIPLTVSLPASVIRRIREEALARDQWVSTWVEEAVRAKLEENGI